MSLTTGSMSLTTGSTDELEQARLLNQNFERRSELSLTEAGDDSAGLERLIHDYLSQSDDEDSSESEPIEEGSDDDCDLRLPDATAALAQAETDPAVIVVDTDSSTASATEFAWCRTGMDSETELFRKQKAVCQF